jgi:hypothetical protein
MAKRKPLSEILVEEGVITRGQLRGLHQAIVESELPVGRFLVGEKLCTWGDIARALAVQFGRDYVPPELLRVRRTEATLRSHRILQQVRAIPVEGAHPDTYAVARPDDVDAMAQLEALVGNRIHVVVSNEDVIDQLLAGKSIRGSLHTGVAQYTDRRGSRRVAIEHGLEVDYSFLTGSGDPVYGRPFQGRVRNMTFEGAEIMGESPDPADWGTLVDRLTPVEVLVHAGSITPDGGIHLHGHACWMRRFTPGKITFGVEWNPDQPVDQACLRALILKQRQLEAAAQAESRDPRSS